MIPSPRPCTRFRPRARAGRRRREVGDTGGPGAEASLLQTRVSAPVPELELEDVIRVVDRLAEVGHVRVGGTARSIQSSGRGMLSSSPLATLCVACANEISPKAFHASTATAATIATAGRAARAGAQEEQQRRRAEREHDQQRFRSSRAEAEVAAERREHREARSVEERRDVHVVRRRHDEEEHEPCRDEHGDGRRPPPLETSAVPVKKAARGRSGSARRTP